MLISDFRAGETSVSTQGNLDSKVYTLGSRKLENVFCSVTGALIVRSGTTQIKTYPFNAEIKVFTWDNNRVIILEDYNSDKAKLRIIDTKTKNEYTVALDHNKIGRHDTTYEVFNASANYFYFKGENVFKISGTTVTELTHNAITPVTATLNIELNGYGGDFYIKDYDFNETFSAESSGSGWFADKYVTLTVDDYYGHDGTSPYYLDISVTHDGFDHGYDYPDITFHGNFWDSTINAYRIGGTVVLKRVFRVSPFLPYRFTGGKHYEIDSYTFNESHFTSSFLNFGGYTTSGGTVIQPVSSKILYKSFIYKRRLYNLYNTILEYTKPDDLTQLDSSVTFDDPSEVTAFAASVDYFLFSNALGIFKFFHDAKDIYLGMISDLKVIEGGLVPYNTIVYAITERGIFSITPQSPREARGVIPVKIQLISGHCSHLFDVAIKKVSRLSYGTRLCILLHRVDDVIIRADIDPASGSAICSRYIFNDMSVYLSNNITDFFIADSKEGKSVAVFNDMRYNIDNIDITTIDYLNSRYYCFLDLAKTYNSCTKISCHYLKEGGFHYIILGTNKGEKSFYNSHDRLQDGSYLGKFSSVGFDLDVLRLPLEREVGSTDNRLKINLTNQEMAVFKLNSGDKGIYYGEISELPHDLIDEYASNEKWSVTSFGDRLSVSKIRTGDKIHGTYISVGYPYTPSLAVHIPRTPFNYVGIGKIKSYGFTNIVVSAKSGSEEITYLSYEFEERLGVYEIGTPELSRENSALQTTTYKLPYGSFGVILSIEYSSYYKQSPDQRQSTSE